MTEGATLLDVLCSAAREAPDQLIVQVDADGAETTQTYGDLLEASRRVAGGLQAAGLTTGQPVILLPGGSADFLPAFWGTLLAGLVPVPLAPATEKVLAVWTQLRHPPVIVDDVLEPSVRRSWPKGRPGAPEPPLLLDVATLREAPPTDDPHEPSPDDLAFLQFSSGSTGAPKGVELSHANVVANIDQVCASGAATAGDVVVSWLPYFHDMGLVGAHLAPLAVRMKQVKLDPLDFVRRPALWFEAASRHRGTVLPAAGFALAVTLERLPAEQVPGLDLRSVRMLGVGAEPISVPSWRRFLAHMRPAGLDPRAVVPLYGLAEATVAVTFPPLGELAQPLALDRAALAQGRAVDAPEPRHALGDLPPDADAAGGPAEFMDVGFPVAGGELRIVDDAGEELGDSWTGHVEFRGPNVARGYHERPEETAASFVDGWLRTGDIGFVRDGRLCITGRAKDVLFVHGQKFHAHDLEQLVAATPGLPPGRVAVVGATDPERGTERVAVFVSTREADLTRLAVVLAAVDTRVRRTLGYVDVHVLPIPPEAFPRTTSGKTQRAKLRERFVAGEFDAVDTAVRSARATVSGAAEPPHLPHARHLPRHAVEGLVIDVWADVLGVHAGTIDRHDRFLTVGGSSLAAMQVLHRLEEVFATTLAPAVLRDCATPAELAEHLLGLSRADGPEPRPPARRDGSSDDAAVIGMACRFPDASTPEAFWDNLLDGRDSVTPVPPARWTGPAAEGPRWGAFLADVAGFDAGFFGVEDSEAAHMDPHARVFLEVAHEALERAGYAGPRRAGLRIGVFVGVGESGYAELVHRGFDAGAPVSSTALVGNLRNLVASRVAHVLDLSGPAMVVDTACSSSLVALHLARRSLGAGECDLAVVGGVSLNLTPTAYRLLDAAQALSPTGRCRAFSADADGIVLGEGAAAVVLRPMSGCRGAGDRALAVVRGSAVNNDGRAMSLLAPNPVHQEAVIVDAYRDAGVDPATVGYVEAHGTGTAVGDPIEARSLIRSLPRPTGGRPRWLGSVKTNVGHLLNAAGMPSLLKVVLALQNRELPASLHSGTAPPAFDLTSAGLELVTRARPWTADGPRRAGVNGFGFGGTNAHVILEEAPDHPSERPAPGAALPLERAAGAATTGGPHLLTLSAASEPALRAVAADLATYVLAHPDLDEGDVCHSASTARDDLPYRVALVADGDLAHRLASVGRGPSDVGSRARRRPRVVFVFTGQGSLPAGMVRALHGSAPLYREAFEELSRAAGPVEGRSLVEWVLDGEDEPTLLARTSVVQPLLLASEVALARLLEAWGVRPDAVLGHSVGEIAAAVVSGALSPVEAVRFAAERGSAMQTACAPGVMAAVSGDVATVERVVEAAGGELSVAAVNGPHHVVLSGTPAAVDAALAVLEQRGCRGRRLAVSRAFHSEQMTPALDAIRTAAGRLRPARHRVPLLSTVTAGWEPVLDPGYLGEQARRTVAFAPCVDRLLDDGYDTFVEVGPGTALRDLVRAVARAHAGTADVAALSALDGDAQDHAALLRTVGRLWVRGVSVSRPGGPSARRRVDVPTYPFQRRRHWLPDPAGPVAAAAAGAEVDRVSPLLHRYAWDDDPLPGGTVLRSLCIVAPSTSRDELPDRLGDHLARRGTAVHRTSSEHLDDAPECSAVLLFLGPSVDLRGSSVDETVRPVTAALLALARHLDGRPTPVLVVTEDVAVTGVAPERARPGQSPAVGLAAALADEDARQAVRVVDLCSLDDLTDRLTALTREVDARPSPGPAERVAWRHGRRLSMAPVWDETLRRTRSDALPPDGRYLVTGGAGGVGAELTRHLAARGAPELVLVGRSATCPSDLLQQLAASGATPRYVRADLTSEADVEALVAGLPALDAVFHAAGVLQPGLLRSASSSDIEEVLAPKVRGTVLLARALTRSGRRPDTFVVLSSIASAVAGHAGGLGGYAAANAFLDAFAEAESHAGRPVQALHLSAVTGTGMAAGPGFRALASSRTVPQLAVPQALEALLDATSVPVPQLLVMQRPSAVVAVTQPRAAVPASRPGPRTTRDLGSGPVATPLRGLVVGLLAEALGEGPDRIDDDTSFLSMGLDSLVAVDLVRQLEQALGRELPTTLLFEHSSVGRLVAHLAATGAGGPGTTPAPDAVRPASSSAERASRPGADAADGSPFGLSPVQLAFHTSGRLHPGTAAYAAVRLTVDGTLDADLLGRSFALLERRHPMLRMRLRPATPQPEQTTWPPGTDECPGWFEVRELEGGVDAVEDEVCNRVVDLETEPPLRAVLLRESPSRAFLLLVVHHAAADGASLAILCEEVWQVYTALGQGRRPVLTPLATHFRDVVRHTHELRASPRFGDDLEHWRRRLGGPRGHTGPPEPTPAARHAPPATSSALQFRTDVATTRALQRTAADLDVSVFHLVLTAVVRQLSAGGHPGPVTVDVARAGRDARLPDIARVVGPFADTLPVLVTLPDGGDLAASAHAVREACLATERHAGVSTLDLARMLPVDGWTPRTAGSASVSFARFPAALDPGCPVRVTGVAARTASAATRQGLLGWEFDGALHFSWNYPTGRFSQEEVQSLTRGFLAELAALVGAAPVQAAGPVAGRVHARCRRQPDATAVRAGGVSLTYGGLDDAARHLCAHLRALGVRRGDRVALVTTPGAGTVVGLLGILYAGATWVPLDGTHPEHRLTGHVEQAGVRVVVCDRGTRDVAARLGREVVDLTGLPAEDATGGWREPEVDPADIAYVIFTSGTTGRPKGVPITHEAMTDYLDWAVSTFGYGPGDRMLATAPTCFDAAVRQLLAPLLAGATVVVASGDVLRDPTAMLGLVQAEGVTVWSSVPTLLAELLRAAESRAAREGTRPDLSSVRWVHVGGEVLPPAHVRRWFDLRGPGCPVVNLYGPTEATINATYEVIGTRPPDDVDRLPIGRPVARTVVDVVAPDGSSCPPGRPGELYLAGPALTPGYLGDPGTGAFVHRDSRRWYRTGDRVLLGPDGRLEYLGRVDEQVKIRGHRVEPAEVERVLRSHPRVRDAAVITVPTGHGPRLAAFVQADDPQAPVAARVTAADLRTYLGARLPEYMLPAQLRVLEALPLTSGGKVDRTRLAGVEDPSREGLSRPGGTAPVTPTERLVAEVWSDLLGTGPVSREDDFFAMGGDSIAVLEVFARLEGRVPGLPSPVTMWSHRTVARLAEAIDDTPPTARPSTDGGDDSALDAFPLTAAQRGFLLAEALAPGTRSSWLTCFHVDGPLDPGVLQHAVDLVVARHLMLRVAIEAGRRPPVQRPVPGPATVLVSVERTEQEDVPRRIAEERAHRFDPSDRPLLRLRVLQVDAHRSRLLVHGHHIIGDGYSVVVLAQELMVLYDALAAGRPAELPPLRRTFRDYVSLISGPAGRAPAAGSGGSGSCADPAYTPPRLRAGATASPASGDVVPPRAGFSLPRRTTAALVALAAAEQTSAYAPVLTAFYRALTRHTGQQDLLLGVAVTGRDHVLPDIGRMVGPFATVIPVRLDEAAPGTQLRHVAARVAAAREGGPSMHQLASTAGASGADLPSLGTQFVFSFLDFTALGPISGETLRLTWDQTSADMEPPLIGTDVLLTARPVDGELLVTVRAAPAALTQAELHDVTEGLRLDLVQMSAVRERRSATAGADVVDAALVGYLPAPADLAQAVPGIDEPALRETIRAALFPDGRARLLEVMSTPWGRSGFVCLPVFADELVTDAGDRLADAVAKAVGLAGEHGARCASLAGMIPTCTAYGFDVRQLVPPDSVAVTTGHAATAASVVRTTMAALERTHRRLRDSRLAVVGVGSVGRSSLELLLARADGPPRQIVLCDLVSRLPFLAQVASGLVEAGYTGQIEVCGAEPSVPGPVYRADLIVAASSAGRQILDVDRLQPGTILVDDSFPHCVEPLAAIRRMRAPGDVVVVGGGLLACAPSSRRLLDGVGRLAGVEHLLSRLLPDTIASCRIESLLQARRPGLPEVLGVVDLESASAYWDALTDEGVAAAPLHLGDHVLTEEHVRRLTRHR